MGIQKEDILKVAKDLKMEISEKDIDTILKEYPETAKNYPNENWSYIVEEMLYGMKPKQPKKITQEDLNNFHGTEGYHKDYLGLLLTDGVKFVMDNCKCAYLITDISSVYNHEPKVLENRKINTFLCVTLQINPEEKTSEFFISEDKDGENLINILYSQKYKVTDISKYFDGKEINFYLIDGVLLLPGEY